MPCFWKELIIAEQICEEEIVIESPANITIIQGDTGGGPVSHVGFQITSDMIGSLSISPTLSMAAGPWSVIIGTDITPYLFTIDSQGISYTAVYTDVNSLTKTWNVEVDFGAGAQVSGIFLIITPV